MIRLETKRPTVNLHKTNPSKILQVIRKLKIKPVIKSLTIKLLGINQLMTNLDRTSQLNRLKKKRPMISQSYQKMTKSQMINLPIQIQMTNLKKIHQPKLLEINKLMTNLERKNQPNHLEMINKRNHLQMINQPKQLEIKKLMTSKANLKMVQQMINPLTPRTKKKTLAQETKSLKIKLTIRRKLMINPKERKLEIKQETSKLM